MFIIRIQPDVQPTAIAVQHTHAIQPSYSVHYRHTPRCKSACPKMSTASCLHYTVHSAPDTRSLQRIHLAPHLAALTWRGQSLLGPTLGSSTHQRRKRVHTHQKARTSYFKRSTPGPCVQYCADDRREVVLITAQTALRGAE